MKPIFRSSMFGFHKGDVFNFITKQNKQYDAKIAELAEEKEKLALEYEKEREAFVRDTTELETLKEKLERSDFAFNKVLSIVTRILEDKSKICQCAGLILEEQNNAQSKIKEMQVRVAEAEKLREKAEKFDQLSGVLSSIFNQVEPVASDECISDVTTETDGNDSFALAVKELFNLLDVLSSHCESLNNSIPSEQSDV